MKDIRTLKKHNKTFSHLFFEALIALLTFKNYTTMPRWMEISMSLEAYICITMVIYVILIK